MLALAFTPDSRGLICSSRFTNMVEYWDISPLVDEPGGHPDTPGVSKCHTLYKGGTCTAKFTASEIRIGIQQVNLGCV